MTNLFGTHVAPPPFATADQEVIEDYDVVDGPVWACEAYGIIFMGDDPDQVIELADAHGERNGLVAVSLIAKCLVTRA